MIVFIVVCLVLWFMRPKIDFKEQAPCEKHQWVEYIVNEKRDGLVCQKCFKRPG